MRLFAAESSVSARFSQGPGPKNVEDLPKKAPLSIRIREEALEERKPALPVETLP